MKSNNLLKHSIGGITSAVLLVLLFVPFFQASAAVNYQQKPPVVKIGEVQGAGASSPLSGTVQSVSGVVTGVKYDADGKQVVGFFLQDDGDGNPSTSDGIYVFKNSNPGVRIGQVVTASGRVDEYFDLTELNITSGTLSLTANTNPLPTPVPLDPPPNPKDAAQYMEKYESMRVTVPGAALVVGPTTKFWEYGVVNPSQAAKKRIFQRDNNSGLVIGVDDGGGPATRLVVKNGDTVTGLVGPLDYSFSVFKINPQPDTLPTLNPGPDIANQQIGAGINGTNFSVASFNMENFFDTVDDPDTSDDIATPAQYQTKLAKLEKAVAIDLNSPLLLGLAEIENETVLKDLFSRPLLKDKNYAYKIGLRTDGRGIKVAFAYQSDKIEIVDSYSYQCYIRSTTIVSLGDPNSKFDCKKTADIDNPPGLLGLYARAPLVLEAKIKPQGANGPALPVVFIMNHFKAKSGTQLPSDPEYDLRRGNEGRELATLVDSIVAGGQPNVMVMGDLNDFESSPALKNLTSGQANLRMLALEVPPQDRYSYIFNYVSQVIDHILVTPNLFKYFKSAQYAKFDADTPFFESLEGKAADEDSSVPNGVSDHNPLLAIFDASSESSGQSTNLPNLGAGGATPPDNNGELFVLIVLSSIVVLTGMVIGWRRRRD